MKIDKTMLIRRRKYNIRLLVVVVVVVLVVMIDGLMGPAVLGSAEEVEILGRVTKDRSNLFQPGFGVDAWPVKWRRRGCQLLVIQELTE